MIYLLLPHLGVGEARLSSTFFLGDGEAHHELSLFLPLFSTLAELVAFFDL